MPDNDNDKVVFLAFANPNPGKEKIDSITMSACSTCRNKTFILIHDAASSFPLLRCAACGQNMGRMGYAPEPGE